MRLLILSDFHHYLRFMEQYVEKYRPDCVIHLGDYYPDGQELRSLCPGIPFYQVPGNCDEYSCDPFLPRVMSPVIGGVRFFLTHGHQHHVKSTPYSLLEDARRNKAQVVLYGHTHIQDLHREEDGLLVMNPGAAGIAGEAGLLEIENGIVTVSRLLRGRDLEETQ